MRQYVIYFYDGTNKQVEANDMIKALLQVGDRLTEVQTCEDTDDGDVPEIDFGL